MSEQIVKIGSYILLEKLAVGGMAEVYLAKTISSDKLVAVKKILTTKGNIEEYAKLFKEEVKVSLNLRHGNIVTFFDFVQEKDQMFLVMEFVNGLNLRKLIGDLQFKKTRLNLAQCLYLISEVASGLDHAHRAVDSITHKKLNVIHRDINPHNIMVTFDGCVKIIDFGIAKADNIEDVTKVGTIKGKFCYMSPEQATAGPLDSRTDIYALGILMWELITGRRLHEGKNDLETLKKVRTAVVPMPRSIDPRIPVDIERMVMRALERDPAARYQKVSDLRFEINAYLQKQFPEFRPSDFADFIGGMYSELIRSRVEKLAYLARVKIASSDASVPDDDLSTKRRRKSVTLDLPEGFESSTGKKENINFDHLKNENNIFAAEVKTQTKPKASNFFSNEPTLEEEEETLEAKWKKFLENSILWNLKHLAMLLIMVYAGVSFYKQFLSNTPVGEALRFDQASQAPPTPNGNGNTEVVTVEAGTDGKAPENVKAIATTNGVTKTDDFSAGFFKQLKASGKLSYANIYLENARSSDTNIYVDGKIIYDKAPIRKLPVYANRVTTITAYNPKTRMYDERKVVVPSGRVMTVNMVLRPYQKK